MSTIAEAPATVVRIGAVSFLNTLPLIEGLGKLRDISLTLTAPSRLVDLLLDDTVDIALASIIDLQRSPVPLALIPAGMIGCDGPTMTVRLFSKVPLDQLRSIHVDADSHTSIALLRIILAERYGLHPELIEMNVPSGVAADPQWPEALLMIGDKIVTNSPPAVFYPHQLDLGEAWKELTGLPFVYAMWMCRADRATQPEIMAAAAILDRQRRHNFTRLDWIIAHRASARGWPVDLAAHYVRDLLRYEVTPAHRAAIERFFQLGAAHNVIPKITPIQWVD